MKKLILLVPVLTLILGFVFGHIIDDKMKKLLSQLDYSEDNAKSNLFSDISGPSFYLPSFKLFKSMSSGDRVSVVETVGKYTKEFTASSDFIKRYNDYRETKKPDAPEKPKSADELKKEQKENIKKAIENMEKTKKQMPADQQASFDETIKSFKEQLKEVDNPDNPMYSKDMENMMQQGYQQQLADYNKEVDEWNKEYPENNPKPMIKKWLQNFLDNTKDINFKAETAADTNGKEIFVKTEFERKDNLWKMCYRAGKAPVEAARKFAQNWLKELK